MTYIDPRQKIYGHLDRLADIKAGQRPPPVTIEVDISNRCSLGCKFCHFAYTHTKGPYSRQRKPGGLGDMGDLMPLPLVKSMLDQVRAYGVRSITWAGGGEPTLHPDFDEIIQYCRIDQGIYTHGGHIGPKRAAIMKQAMTWVYISFDRHTRQSFIDYKGADYFEQTCKGIKLLAAADGKATIGVGFLLSRDSWQDAPAMYELGMSLGADYVQFRPTVLYNHERPGQPVEDAGWVEDAIRVLGKLAGCPGLEADLSRFAMYRDWQGHGYKTCYWSAVSTVITPNGKVWTCCNTRGYPGHELGDMTKETFLEIWERGKPAAVGPDCRLLCRGHVANIALDAVFSDREHGNFI